MYQVIEVADAGHEPGEGHATTTVGVGRIPCVGETIVMWGLPRWVTAVSHLPIKHPQQSHIFPLATIWVADEPTSPSAPSAPARSR